MGELQYELNRLAGTTDLNAQGAANRIAGTTHLDLVGALNRIAGTTHLDLNGAVKAVAALYGGNSSLDANGALVGAVTSVAFPTIAGLNVRYKADLETAANASALATLVDQSGNSRNATQATGTLQPTLRHNVLNSKKVVRFDGGDRIVSASWSLVQPLTVFVVGKNSIGTAGNLCDGSNAAANTMVVQVGATQFVMYAGAFLNDGTRNSNFNIFVATFNGASSKYWVGGGVGTTGNPGAGAPGGVCLGAAVNGGAPLNGDIAELCIYSSALSTANVNSLGAYAAYEYGLTWSTAS